MARPICLRLLALCIRAAAERTFWTAGSSRPGRTAMMAITTNSQTRVNAARRTTLGFGVILPPFKEKNKKGGAPPERSPRAGWHASDARIARRGESIVAGLGPTVLPDSTAETH